MLTRDGADSALFIDIDSLIGGIGLKTVEATRSDHQGTVTLRVAVAKYEGEVNTDDLAKAYNLIYPRYSLLLSERDLELEVSSPGMQRNLKDVREFSVFRNRLVRVYSISHSSYLIGRIGDADSESVVLLDYEIEDTKEKGDSIKLGYDDIAKAKLECRWEADNA